ncbi:MAG: sulfatase [Pirellulales bacterium]
MLRIGLCLFILLSAVTCGRADDRPNVIVLFADDLGYGDLGCYGSPTIRTPNLDRMAREGMRFTDFYSAAEVCTPSRAALLTGRLPIRNGMCGKRRVLFGDSKGGLPDKETTIAEVLKGRGYATMHIGKWHLGIHPGSQPLDQGFEHSYGLPYSNDMDARPNLPKGSSGSADPPADGWNVALMRDGEVIERPAVQSTLTKRYTEEAQRFIREHKQQPYFLYLAHTFPHVPLFASDDFKGKSRAGIFGDAVEELDWSVGQILDTVRKEGAAENTLVFFTSDNGPWLIMGDQGGSAGLLREGKGSTWEGGMRVPGIAWMPGRIQPQDNHDLVCSMDLFPTIASMAGASVTDSSKLDGRDISSALVSGKPLGDRPYFYYRGDQLYACRIGQWKAHFRTQAGYGQAKPDEYAQPLLFDLGRDPSEKRDVSAAHPDVIAKIQSAVEEHRKSIEPVASQLDE